MKISDLRAREWGVGIIGGLISSALFLWFIEPLARGLWVFINAVTAITYIRITDSIYEQAAHGHAQWVAVTTLALLLAFVVLFLTVYALRDRLQLFFGQEIPARRSLLRVLNVGGLIGMWVGTFGLCFGAYADLQMNTSFRQRLDALGPFLSDREIKVLKSKWALMQNRYDYESINKLLETHAERARIHLPELLLK